MDEDSAIRRLAQEISSYLDEHPDAVDSADGILRWWLPRRRIDATAEHVERALELLIADGIVERRRLPDGRSVFARAHPRGGFGAGSFNLHS